MAVPEAFQKHMATGLTSVAHCWQIIRKDGVILGFTDHDCDLSFVDTVFRAGTGLTALALTQAAGLSVDNTEAMGALSDAAISEVDIEAGLYDGAKVTAWLVNWSDVGERTVVFRGSVGEITRSAGAFQVELRGLTEALNRPLGRVFQKPCSAVLGDAACGFDVLQAGFYADAPVWSVSDNRVLQFEGLPEFAPGWFTRGQAIVLSGDGAAQMQLIKSDGLENGRRVIALWSPFKISVAPGTQVRLIAGCDKRFATCQAKFANSLNFRGFPDIPGDGWISSVPRQDGRNGGGSLR